MNSETDKPSDAIRSDIEDTRRRMDDTINALGQRMKGRHLVDEVIGIFRPREGDESHNESRERLLNSAQSALQSVGEAVKKNPLPLLVIGAGVGWLVYNNVRQPDASGREDADGYPESSGSYPGAGLGGAYAGEDVPYDEGEVFERSAADEDDLEGGPGESGGSGSSLREKAGRAADEVGSKLSNLSQRLHEGAGEARSRAAEMGERLKGRASELSDRVKDQTTEAYRRTRRRVGETVDNHPLETGLVCLTAGLLLGLTLPTPEPVNRVAGPTVGRLRERTRQASSELLDKGTRVVQEAASAAQQTAADAARREGLVGQQSSTGNTASTGAEPPAGQTPAEA